MKFSILKNKKYGFIFSGALVALSALFLILPGFRLQMGIDFVGGTEYLLSFEESEKVPSSDEIKNIYSETFKEIEKSPKSTFSSNGHEVSVRSHTLSHEEQIQILETFEKNNFLATVEGVSTVGSSLGDYFKIQAFWTILAAISMIILYLAWAFRKVPAGISSFKFGLAAIIALLHDVFITTGVFAFLGAFISGLEVDTMYVTALLTVLGFSVHDTIVVFDRLRENLIGKKISAKVIEKIAENSIWQTMGRSLHTSISTLFVLGAVLILGAPSLFAFIFALAFGILIGTYSSIFLATPILIGWIKKDLEANQENPEISKNSKK